MKTQINEIKRMQLLAGIINEAQDEVKALSGFEWLSKIKVFKDSNMSALDNAENQFDYTSYLEKITDDQQQRDWGIYLGDSVFSQLKDQIEFLINNLSDSSTRNFLENPTLENAGGDEKLLAQTLKWKEWTESIPNVGDAKYLSNAPEFNTYLQNPLDKLVKELTTNTDKKTASLVWGILPYLAFYWDDKVTRSLNMKLDKNITAESFNQLEEAAGEDLELKSAAKQIFSVLKKYGLTPQYEADGKQFRTKDPNQSGYGAYIHVNNGIMTISVYDRGIWQTIQRKQKTNELDMGNVNYPTEEEKKQINQIAGKIYNDIMAVLDKDKFDFRNNQEPDKYGNYMIYVRKKQTAKGGAVNPNQRPNAPKPAEAPVAESFDQLDEVVDKVLAKLRNTK